VRSHLAFLPRALVRAESHFVKLSFHDCPLSASAQPSGIPPSSSRSSRVALCQALLPRLSTERECAALWHSSVELSFEPSRTLSSSPSTILVTVLRALLPRMSSPLLFDRMNQARMRSLWHYFGCIYPIYNWVAKPSSVRPPLRSTVITANGVRFQHRPVIGCYNFSVRSRLLYLSNVFSGPRR
jgi:hypothetical protein